MTENLTKEQIKIIIEQCKKGQKMNINWYPGHMAKTKKQIAEDLKLIDVVIEILDARIPISSRNPDIDTLTQGKKKIIVLNKADLADEQENEKWVVHLKKEGIIAVLVDSNLGTGVNKVQKQIENIMKEELERQAAKGRIGKNIRIMVLRNTKCRQVFTYQSNGKKNICNCRQ